MYLRELLDYSLAKETAKVAPLEKFLMGVSIYNTGPGKKADIIKNYKFIPGWECNIPLSEPREYVLAIRSCITGGPMDRQNQKKEGLCPEATPKK